MTDHSPAADPPESGPAVGTPPSLTAPLRHAPFRALAAGRMLLYFGNGLATVALAFAVLDATGSIAQLGLVVGARTSANVVLLLAGGVLADRMPRALLMRGACAIAAVSQLALAAALVAGVASLPLMIALSVVNGAAAAANLPAAASLVPQTVPGTLLRQANALVRIGMEGGRIVGMSVGTLLVALIGAAGAIAVDGVSFALAGVCFLFIRIPAAARSSEGHANPLRELADGWTEFARRRWVWVVVAQFMVVNAVMSALIAVLGPAIADATFGRTAWGAMLTLNSVGLLVGGLLAARWQPQRALFFGVALIAVDAVPVFLLGASPWVPVLFAAMFLAGVAVEQFTVAWEVSVQQNIPPDRLARVYSYDALGSFLAMPIGQVAVGPLAQAFGVRATLVGAALLILAVTALCLAEPGVRRLRRTDPSASH